MDCIQENIALKRKVRELKGSLRALLAQNHALRQQWRYKDDLKADERDAFIDQFLDFLVKEYHRTRDKGYSYIMRQYGSAYMVDLHGSSPETAKALGSALVQACATIMDNRPPLGVWLALADGKDLPKPKKPKGTGGRGGLNW